MTGRILEVSLLLGCCVLAACGSRSVEPGSYRGVLKLPGGELPFGLELKRDGADTTGFLRDSGPGAAAPDADVPAEGPVKFTRVIAEGPTLKILIRGDDSQILARSRGTGLEGEWVMRDAEHREHRISFAARRDANYRFFETAATDNADISGPWSVTFVSSAGAQTQAAEFAQSHAEVGGRFSGAGNQVRRVTGEVHNDDVYLCSFDGAQAFLYKATVLKDGTLKGEFWSATGERGSWTATRRSPAPAAT